MSTWRRKALELFPDLRTFLDAPDTTLMLFFFELGGEVKRAHRADDDARLRAIYSFAEWCARQPGEELWNPAGVGFYEDVFDDPLLREKVALWLPYDIRADHEGLWELMLKPADFAALKKMLKRTPPRTNGASEAEASREIHRR
jgi:hypothetical protein